MYRTIYAQIHNTLETKWSPIILLLGARQTGKTTLAESLVRPKVVRFNFDLVNDIHRFSAFDRESLDIFATTYAHHDILIDEVQKYPEATGTIKYLYDTYKNKDLRFILTGSSEIRIRHSIGDSLTGRVYEVHLYPLSLAEMNIQSGLSFDFSAEWNNIQENQSRLRTYLVFGSLPSSQNLPLTEYPQFLKEYVNHVFSKDLLEIGNLRKPIQALFLAKLLAHQIGQLVNVNELALHTELNRETVLRFLDFFEQLGMITVATPLSTNERESISKAKKIYFTDLGIRNALINNFDEYHLRLDKGQLLENAVFMGIKRQLEYQRTPYQLGFFRSSSGSEIDIVKKTEQTQSLYEIKTSGKKTKKTEHVTYITLENAQRFLY
ncbi:MAG: ATP-binding protein [Candidatus Pacebacteria bacterium]|nr:ATP-binding protein [Candidatus Paceibacterota bacterium]